ncbi:MAG TPA: hypothetical protein RMH99_21035 [Sandaracinaceae bacterium LLY-WYZ-13_1]|nr:hypothetical protein [Sandaracinaceae bacterium LLY-WYZ-13_1]
MRITLLDALADDTTSARVRTGLSEAGVLGADHRLRGERFAPCQGCFQCWVEHPGTCRAKDAANGVMRDVIEADAILWLTRPRFGAWDPVAKVALDKTIGLLLPFFGTVEGETHHLRRYPRYPRWAVLASVPPTTPDDEREAFRLLVERNALNLHEHAPRVSFVPTDADATTVREAARGLVGALEAPSAPVFPQLAPFEAPATAVRGPAETPRHAVIWVGSAKPAGTSTSEALGAALEARLAAEGWTTERLHVARTVKLGRGAAPKLVEAARRADLLVLASPVYFDALPSIVLAGLAALADADLGDEAPALLPIVQCGFPELAHTALAVEVAHRAAAEAGMPWAGHLALGGGGALHGANLDEATGKAARQVEALDEVAAALDAGRPVPAEATDAFATPILSPRLYRAVGQVGWLARALKEGAATHLWDRPFEG